MYVLRTKHEDRGFYNAIKMDAQVDADIAWAEASNELRRQTGYSAKKVQLFLDDIPGHHFGGMFNEKIDEDCSVKKAVKEAIKEYNLISIRRAMNIL